MPREVWLYGLRGLNIATRLAEKHPETAVIILAVDFDAKRIQEDEQVGVKDGY